MNRLNWAILILSLVSGSIMGIVLVLAVDTIGFYKLLAVLSLLYFILFLWNMGSQAD